MRHFAFLLKKEFLCIVRDKKIIYSVLMPLIIFPLVYTVLGYEINESKNALNNDIPIAIIGSAKQTEQEVLIRDVLPQLTFKIIYADEKRAEEMLKNEEAYVSINMEKGENAYDIEIKYNSNVPTSSAVADMLNNAFEIDNLTQYKTMVESTGRKICELCAHTEDISPGSIILSIIPMFITMFLFSGICSISVDMFAGEKERGTLEQLLSTQTPRENIFISKLIVIIIFGLVNALISTLGYIISIYIVSKQFDGEMFVFTLPKAYIISVVILLFSLTLLAAAIFSVISISAQTVKSGQSVSNLVSLIPGMLSIIVSASPINHIDRISLSVPIYNNIILIKAILAKNCDIVNILYVMFIDLLCTAVLIFICMKMMNSEKYILQHN